ncbi:MAG: hypothetical protein K8I30_09390 [Anaerolineae bacterium]|nr:hypothetical protein [Anaerolineae bacterium]
MMRRLLVMVLLAFAVMPFAAAAQDQKIGWDLDESNYIDVQDLGFRFHFPTGWVYDVDSGEGIAMADSQASMDAHLDDDDSTTPEGLIINIRGLPLEALTDLGENPTLNAIADFAVQAGGITETEPRVEVPVLARHSITIIGTNSDGRAGFATIWRQDGNLVLLSLGAPDTQTRNELAYTWGVTLGWIRPLGALELSDDKVTDTISQFTIPYPEGWTPNPDQPASVYELAEDVGSEITDMKGAAFAFSDAALSDLGLEAGATLDEVAAVAKGAFDLGDDVSGEEFVLLGQPAVTFRGVPASDSGGAGHGVILTVGLVEERAILLILVTPSMDAADAFMPTWLMMLSSVTSTAGAS